MSSTWLIDVNGLIALAYTAHPDHPKMLRWFATASTADRFATCSITEIGFLRVALQARLSTELTDAQLRLAGLSSHTRFSRLNDDVGGDTLPAYVKKPADITDGHLLALATRHGAKLATLDTDIPGAELIR